MLRTSPLVLTLALTVGCMADYYLGDDSVSGADNGDSADPGSEDEGDTQPPEQENDFLRLRPAATESYIFVVNSARNTVSRIAVPELDVRTVEVGVNPKVVIATPDNERAVVFNEGTDDVTIIDADTMETSTIAVREHFNAMVMSPDGVWVACYRDPDEESDESGQGGAQSFNEVSLVNTITGEHFLKVVGYNPRQVKFTDDSSLALVVSDEYLAVIDLLQANPPVRMIQVAEDLLDPPPAEEVEVSPTGTFAFVRQFGEDNIVIVDLASDLVDRVPVGLNPTDLDLSPDGLTAVVVSRGSNELYVFDAADPTVVPTVVTLPETELLGSIQFSPDNTKAVLYTTAADINHYTTWDIATDTFTVRSLQKPVAGVNISPDGGTLLVFHEKLRDAPDTPTDNPFYRHDALTLISLDDFRQNTLLLAAEPTAWANSTDGAWGFFVMEGEPYLEVLDYAELHHDEIGLRSDPVHVGVLPGTTYAFVNQEHDLGRLSFYDPTTDALETITGFELNSGIEH